MAQAAQASTSNLDLRHYLVFLASEYIAVHRKIGPRVGDPATNLPLLCDHRITQTRYRRVSNKRALAVLAAAGVRAD